MRTRDPAGPTVVNANKKNRLFHAKVVGGVLIVEPIERNISSRQLRASEISSTGRTPSRPRIRPPTTGADDARSVAACIAGPWRKFTAGGLDHRSSSWRFPVRIHASTQSDPAERIKVGADEVAIRVTSAETDGALLAIEVWLPAGGGPPMLHRHAPLEVYRVERGELVIYLEDDEGEVRQIVAAAGAVVHIGAGREHTIRNESDAEALAYVTFAPAGGIERFMRAAGAAAANGPPDPADVLALAERHGIEMTRPVPTMG
jgi:mannose-6-phosphate isomerase-like protein (cupin superfamily)